MAATSSASGGDGSGDYDHLFKILMVGDSDVGKSSILLRFTENKFDEDQPCTIGVDFKIKYCDIQSKRINLTIWDTAGQEKFRSLTSSYYRGTHGIILVYDVSRKVSFEHVNQWLDEVELYSTNPDAIKMLIGNKVDKERQVRREEAAMYARDKGMLFIECSAKTTQGIQQAFQELLLKILDTPKLVEECITKERASNDGRVDVTSNSGSTEDQPDPCAGWC
ncbi:Rab18 family GTPase [Pelomyxa schiedti]|nr:Rab18 family GTPase [Pelomyxa schiedti]